MPRTYQYVLSEEPPAFWKMIGSSNVPAGTVTATLSSAASSTCHASAVWAGEGDPRTPSVTGTFVSTYCCTHLAPVFVCSSEPSMWSFEGSQYSSSSSMPVLIAYDCSRYLTTTSPTGACQLMVVSMPSCFFVST